MKQQTQIERLQSEIRALQAQLQELEIKQPVSTEIQTDAVSSQEIAANFIAAAKQEHNAQLERAGTEQAAQYFKAQINARKSKLRELIELEEEKKLAALHWEGEQKMRALQSKLEEHRQAIAAIMEEIKMIAKNRDYAQACFEITGSQWWNNFGTIEATSTTLTQLNNGITWGLGVVKIIKE